MTNYKILILIILITISKISLAKSNSPNKLMNCKPTKTHESNFEPEVFIKSNNLLRMPGEPPYNCKEKLLIKGKVRDPRCVPLSDVIVKIWQTNEHGKYPYKPLRNVYVKSDIDLSHNENFTGNGTAITNNKGEFYFLTCMPSKFKGIKPHIDIRVHHNLPDYSNYRHFVTKTRDTTDDFIEKETPEYTIKDGYINEFIITVPNKGSLKEF